jgi:LysM repeat protein
MRQVAARFGWRLGALGALLTTIAALTIPTLSEARAVETAATSPALAPAELAVVTHLVQPGDTLYAIALANGTTVEHIATVNVIPDPDFIRVGQILNVPTGPVLVASSYYSGSGASTYTVQQGDTLSEIAARSGVPVDVIMGWNGLTDADRIASGTRLKLDGSAPGTPDSGAPRALGDWAGSPNYWPGRPSGQPIALVIHTMGGSMIGAQGQFASISSGTSAHFGIGLDGRVQQYVQLSDRAWANGWLEDGHSWPGPVWVNPNDLTVSIETEDFGSPDQAVTDAQFQATARIGRLVLSQYPSIRYLMTHRAISPQSRAEDPGPRWLAKGKMEALANTLGLKLIQ